jgi:signal transduction histidine kinase
MPTHAPGADARGVAADTREETADARGVSADAREADANERELAADAREAGADAREAGADARTVNAAGRGVAVDVREAKADEQNRLRQLLEASIALNSELSLDALLTKLVETAAAVVGARYAAFGVLDAGHTTLERFITSGIDAETRAEIGDLPRGRGILGVLIREARPLRLRDLMEDPRAVGFPPGHPPMHGFLGVPVLLRGAVFGNLYLTEKEDGEEFTAEDEELVTMLAVQAAVVIENVRLYESATRWLHQLDSLNRVANELVGELELPHLLELVADSLRELIGARIVTIWLPAPDGALRLAAAAGEWPREVAGLGARDPKLGQVFERARSERADFLLDDLEIDQQIARRVGIKTGLWTPLLVRGQAVGVIACYDRLGPDPRFSDDDVRVAETLAARAAVAVDLRQRISRDSVRALLAAQELERKRMARELHDETGQALTSILLALKPLEALVGADAISPVRELVAGALADVRRLAVQLRPSVLDDFGLVPALARLTHDLGERSGLAVEFDTNLADGERLPEELETVLYRISQEALTNVLKHASAGRVQVRLARLDGSLTLTVEDDGDGFTPSDLPEERLGVVGMRERVSLLAGSFTLNSVPGQGTRLVAELPLAGAAAPATPAGD